jgi:ankyrin repeat protein
MSRPKSYRGIMVSSTFTDLMKHREILIDIIHNHGLVANAMEFNGACADADVLAASLKMVCDSAAYIGVISRKYGQIPDCQQRNPKGLSITELEFNEAVRLKRPILLFVMNKEHALREDDVEIDTDKRAKLHSFRESAKLWHEGGKVNRVYQNFRSLEEFSKTASVAIAKLITHVGKRRCAAQGRHAKRPARKGSKDAKKSANPARFLTYPYRGGEEFGIDDGDIYFGREKEVDELLTRLRQPDARFQFIQGPSGVGKSSLLTAGLLYRILKKNELGVDKTWSYSLFRPAEAERNPFAALVLSLVLSSGGLLSGNRSELAKSLWTASNEGIEAASVALEDLLLSRLPGGVTCRLMIAVNQFEEIWTRTPRFVEPVLNFICAAERNPRVVVLLTIRDDFALKFVSAPQIVQILRKPVAFQYPLAPPRIEQIEDIIAKPQQIDGVDLTLGNGFVARVAADASKLGETALPIVALMLEKMRVDSDTKTVRNRFNVADYEAFGGLDGIVATLAREGSGNASSELQDKLFDALIELQDRRPVMLDADRERLASTDPAMEQLVEGLIEARLLYLTELGGRASVRLFHQALTTHWKELDDWIRRNEFVLAVRDELKRDAELWARRGRYRTDVKLGRERLEEIDDLVRRIPNLLENHRTTQAYLNACRITVWKDDLIDAVKGGQVTLAYAAIKKLRRLKVKSLLDLDNRGTNPHQLKPAFWAAITGDDRPDEVIAAKSGLEPKPTDENGPSIFDGEEGKFVRDATTSRGMTPLQWAAFAGQIALVRKLIRLGANAENFDDSGANVLHAAAVGGNFETVTFLIETAHIDPLKSARDGARPIIWAIQERHAEVIDYLRREGQSLALPDIKFGWNVLTEAARADDAELVRNLIEDWNYSVDHKTEDGQTPLHVACTIDHAESAEAAATLATVFKADLLAASKLGYTPLHVAASQGKISAIDVLVREAAERRQLDDVVNATNINGDTALHVAARERRWMAVERLLSADIGIGPDLVNKSGATALEVAVVNYDRRSAQILLDHNARTDVFPTDGWPPLHLAADNGDLDIVERLLKAKSGINLDATERAGWTALMIAARQSHVEIVEALLGAGASPSHVSRGGQDVFSVAFDNGHFDLVDTLKHWVRARTDMAEALSRLEVRTRQRAMRETLKTTDREIFVDDSSRQRNILVLAAAAGNVAKVQSLLADVTDLDVRSQALSAAAARGWDAVVDLLLEGKLADNALSAAAKAAAAFSQTRTARRLVDRGALPPPLWQLPRISDAATFLSFTEATDAERQRLAPEIEALERKLSETLRPCRLRRAALPCFAGHGIIAFEDTSVPGQNEQFAIEKPGGSLLPLNWTNEPIYQLADKTSPDFSDAGVLLYTRFFFHWVRGQMGRFEIVEHPSEVRWKDFASEEMRNDVESRILKLRIFDRSAADHIRLKGTVIFRNALFETDILIATCETDIFDPDIGESDHFTVGQMKLLNEKLLLNDLGPVLN